MITRLRRGKNLADQKQSIDSKQAKHNFVYDLTHQAKILGTEVKRGRGVVKAMYSRIAGSMLSEADGKRGNKTFF